MNNIARHISILLPLVALSLSAGASPLDVTIKGEARDKISIERVSPPLEIPLKDAVPFSRQGKTDAVLNNEMGYFDEEKQVALMDIHSPKTFSPSMVEFPKPPFFIQAYPAPEKPFVVDRRPNAPPLPGEQESWTFLVIDQANTVLKKIEGNTIPTDPIQWDGTSSGQFMLRTDEVYSSMLIIRETPEIARTIVGEPVFLPALRYTSGNSLVFEFSNRRLYKDNQATFSRALDVLVNQLMNELRKYQGTPFQVVVYDRDPDMGEKRVKLWRRKLEAGLLAEAETFNVTSAFPDQRGDVTQVVIRITK